MSNLRKTNKKADVVYNTSLPIFWNFSLDKGRLKNFVLWFLKNHGEKKTILLLEQLKTVGYGYATKAGISLGIEDLKIPPNKAELLAKAEVVIARSNFDYRKGDITGIEKMQQFIETWHETSETLKNEVVRYFEKTDILNPVYMMAFSGARGNLSQVRQLVGMRGLMADPQGKIIDFPIQSNFREGLTLTEYLISTYGARKGIVDTALRTATAGYLTRRLVDVAQHVIVSKFDCGTQRGIFLFDMKEGNKTIYSFSNRLTGRVLAQDIYSSSVEKQPEKNPPAIKLASRNQEITVELAVSISKMTKKALVRSPLTCETRKLVCQLCYGWSLATSRLVSIGEAVGVIAGQSIGEPGTQLTMRTFHTGGVFAGGITEQINTPFSGIVEYAEPISGTCIRTPQGFLAFLTKTNGTLFLKKGEQKTSDATTFETSNPPIMNAYKIPPFTVLFARHGEFLEQGKLLAQISALPTGEKSTQTIEQTIYSSLEGEVYYNQIDLLEDIDEKYGERISKAEDWSKVWVLSAKITKDPLIAEYLPVCGDFVNQNSIVNQIQWVTRSAQFSYIQAPNAAIHNLQKVDYSYSIKTPYKPQSNFSFHNPRLNANLAHLETPLHKYSNPGLIKPVKVNTGNIQIFSHYQLREKFSLKGVNFAPPNFSYEKPHVNSTQLKKMETVFNYPYQVNLRSYFVKLLTQTIISVPILRSGVLSSWVKYANLNVQKKKPRLNISLQKDRKILVRKLNMNKKYRFYSTKKPNFFHPLILSNYVPFLLLTNRKTIQHFFKRKTTPVNTNFEVFRFYPYGDQTFENLSKTAMSFPQFLFKEQNIDLWLYTKCLENVTKNYTTKKETNLKQTQKGLFKKFNSYFTEQSLTNQAFLKKSEKKGQKLKLNQLSIKSPILFFTPKNVRYQKHGYYAAASIKTSETDQFFSLLPLDGDSSPTNQKKNLVENSSGSSRFTTNRVNNLNSMNTVHLNNTDVWDLHSTQGFYWFPKFSQTFTNGMFLISSPIITQKVFRQKFGNLKLKNLKSTLNFTTKSLQLLNLAQSQNQKRQSVKKPRKKKQKSTFVKKNTFIDFFNGKTHNFKPTPKEFKSLYQGKHPLKNNKLLAFLKSQKRNYSSLVWKKSPKEMLLALKTLKKTQSLKNFHSKYIRVLHSRKINTKPVHQKELQKLKETKTPSFSKKDFKNVQNLKVILNFSKKLSANFHEIYWLPQENYLFHTICNANSLQNQTLKKTGLISYQTKTPCLGKKSATTFFLTNAQGFKKEFLFKSEGLLKVKKLNAFKATRFEKANEPSENTLMNKNTKKRIFAQTFSLNLKTSNNLNLKKTNVLKNKKSFAKLKNLTQELKLKFLNYMLTKKSFKQKVSSLTNLNVLTLKSSIFVTKKDFQSFFSFSPFLNFTNKSLNATPEKIQNLKSISKKWNVNTISHVSKEALKLSIKPGWVYKTENLSNLLTKHKTWVNPGKQVLDDINFNHQKVFLEIIPQTSKTPKNEFKLEFKSSKNSFSFNPSLKVYNSKARFFKQNSKTKINGVKHAPTSLLFLIRTATYSMLPNLPQMKKALYKAMKKSEMGSFNSSYFSYKKYFSTDLNPQTRRVKTVLSFAPMDLNLSWHNYFQSTSFCKKLNPSKIKPTKFKNKQKNVPIANKPKVQVNRYKSVLAPFVSVKNRLKNTQKNHAFFKLTRNQEKNTQKNSGKVYFSNYPMNFLQLKISLDLSKTRVLSYSFPQISLNTNQTNMCYLNNNSFAVGSKVKSRYLNILVQRQLEKFHLNQTEQTTKQLQAENIHYPGSLQLSQNTSLKNGKKNKLVNLKSVFPVNYSMPFFEYSMNQKYGFFANQKLFASSFYQQQYENFLKITTVENNLFLKETVNGKRFVKTNSTGNNLAESNRYYHKSKNQLIFNQRLLNNDKPIGLTSFYSPYEGEVLKIYSRPKHSQEFQNLKKSVNIFLDQGLLNEKQQQKLILTKSDIYGINLPTSSDLNSEKHAKIMDTPTLLLNQNSLEKTSFFKNQNTQTALTNLQMFHQRFKLLEKTYNDQLNLKPYQVFDMTTYYQNKRYKIKNLNFNFLQKTQKLRLGDFINPGEKFYSNTTFLHSGFIIHLNSKKLTLRKAEFFLVSPDAILHSYNGHCLTKNSAVMTLPFQTLKTGDIVQGIPKVEQYLEARTTIRGRLFLNSLPVLLHAIFQRYSSRLNLEKAVRQSFLKIQQILVDGVQRVYRSQGVSIADKHLEVIVRQMTSKVKIVYGGQTGFFPGELVDLEFVERINRFLMVKIRYEPVVLGITRASLEVDSFLSAASFQQTTKVLARSAMENKRDFLKGLKENLLVGNLLPAGTGYVVPLSEKTVFQSF